MSWLPLILITSMLSSSGAFGGSDHGRPITLNQTDTVNSQWDIFIDQEYNEVEVNDEIQSDDVYSNTSEDDSSDDYSSDVSGSVSVNQSGDPEDFGGEDGSTEAAENGFGSGYDDTGIRSDVQSVTERLEEVRQHTEELRVIEEQNYTLFTYICGILIFLLLVVLLKYIYKFFRIFF